MWSDKIDVVEVGQKSFQESQESFEVLWVVEEPVCVEVDSERCTVSSVEPAEVVPEVGESVSETSGFRLSRAVARVHHGARPPWPVQPGDILAIILVIFQLIY